MWEKLSLVKHGLARHSIRKRNRIFLDLHGEAVETLLKLIPSWRINDVVYFNPADIDFPISFNVMKKLPSPEYRHIVASGLLDVFKKNLARCLVSKNGIHFTQHYFGFVGSSKINDLSHQQNVG